MNLEDRFKHKLKEHKVDWNKEELLVPLKQELSKENRRFDWRWLLLLPLVCIATCWGGYSLGDSDVSPSIGISSFNENGNKNDKSNNKLNNKSNSTSSSNESEILNMSNAESNITEGALSVQSDNTSNINDEPFQSIPELNHEQLEEQGQAQLQEQNIKQNLKQELNLPSVQNITTSPKFNVLNFTGLSIGNFANAVEQAEHFKPMADVKTSNQSENKEDTSKPYEYLDFNDLALKTDERTLANIHLSQLDVRKRQLLYGQRNIPLLDTRLNVPEKDKKLLSNPFYVSASAEFGLHYRDRNYNSSNATYVSRLEANEDTERSLAALYSNLNIGYQFASNWSVQSGIEYGQLNEVFDYNTQSTELVPVETVLYFIVDIAAMDTTYVKDTSTVTRTTDRTIKHYNKQVFYSIPLQLAYDFDLNNINFRTRLGLNYTFAHSFNGRYNLIKEGGGNEIVYNNAENDFSLSDRVGLQLGLDMVYPIKKQAEFFLSAAYRRSPKLSMNVIDQRYHSMALGVGFRYCLGG